MILCCGEALIDMLPRTSTEGEACYAPYAGGAVFNTAIALGRLGAQVGFFSGIAQDMMGEVLTDTLKASKVDISNVVLADRPSTVAFVKLVNGQATYAFYDEGTAGRLLAIEDLPNEVTADAMFFGGISLPVEPCGATYEALCLREAPKRVIMMDPNIRPGFIRDEAAYRARIERMTAACDIIKLSDEDLNWLVGEGDLIENARKIIAKGPKLVCITEGANGSYGITADNVVFVPANKVEVIDTVGAGDTFNAGVLASLQSAGKLSKDDIASLDEDTIKAALSLGNRSAAITVSRAGANPPWSNEL
ncbi:carbohydrate kinase [Marivivens donghaensis]|uniref:Carbohydrate kinase n=1 Tax=Marivivens donghaensis TaxID=1699413 RepID=A0ABX0VX67_9RHOB|nr:carbohydrate kinase [Marivivens donghaensis]NIY72394.1 carbohydrate kinase [Marivivens donghaensis]